MLCQWWIRLDQPTLQVWRSPPIGSKRAISELVLFYRRCSHPCTGVGWRISMKLHTWCLLSNTWDQLCSVLFVTWRSMFGPFVFKCFLYTPSNFVVLTRAEAQRNLKLVKKTEAQRPFKTWVKLGRFDINALFYQWLYRLPRQKHISNSIPGTMNWWLYWKKITIIEWNFTENLKQQYKHNAFRKYKSATQLSKLESKKFLQLCVSAAWLHFFPKKNAGHERQRFLRCYQLPPQAVGPFPTPLDRRLRAIKRSFSQPAAAGWISQRGDVSQVVQSMRIGQNPQHLNYNALAIFALWKQETCKLDRYS